MLYCVSILVYVYYVVYVYLCCIVYVCLYMCMYVGEHSCRPSLLCNPVFDKIDNNNNNNNKREGDGFSDVRMRKTAIKLAIAKT